MTNQRSVYHFLLSLLLLVPSLSWAQTRTYQVNRSANEIKIDGDITEQQWLDAEIATDFIESYPSPGIPSKYLSKVRLYYDDVALYVAGEMHDPKPDSVSYTLSQRDDWGNADWFAIILDPYANNINAFSFSVTAAGVEYDALLYTDASDVSLELRLEKFCEKAGLWLVIRNENSFLSGSLSKQTHSGVEY